MLSSNNILSPAHGAPLATPTQDMVLGHLLPDLRADAEIDERRRRRSSSREPHPFRTAQEAELAYENGLVELHDYAEYRRAGHEHFLTTVGRIIFNDRVERALADALGDEYDPERYEFVNHSLKKNDVNEIVSDLVEAYGAPAVAQVLDAFKDLGLPLRDPGRDHDLQERHRLAAQQGGDPRALRGAGGRRSRASTTRATSPPRSARRRSPSAGTRRPRRSRRRWRTTSTS